MWERLFQPGAVPGCPWRSWRSWIFPFPCFCLCLPCLTRLQRQLRGIWVEMWSFPGILLGVTFSKPFLYPSQVPGSARPRGVIPAGSSQSQGFPVVFPGELAPANPSLALLSRPASSVHPHSEHSMFAVEWEPLEPLFQGFSRAFPCRGLPGTFGSVTVSTNHGFIPRETPVPGWSPRTPD